MYFVPIVFLIGFFFTLVIVFNFQTIADAITVTLPYVAKKLIDSVTTIVSALKDFLSNPVQSITIFGKSVLEYVLLAWVKYVYVVFNDSFSERLFMKLHKLYIFCKIPKILKMNQI